MLKVIFDTDPGVDDAMALLFLHRHPAIDLIGITTVFGNGSVETTTRNVQFLSHKWGIDSPIARGASRPIDGRRVERSKPATIHGENGLGDIDIPPTVDVPLDPRSATEFIIDAVRADPGQVTLVAVGRMTNLALVLQADPQIASLVKEVVIMGGAFDVNGNSSPAAEANILGDPEAADAVMTANWKVTVIGLDVTMKTVMTRAFLAEMAVAGDAGIKLLSDLSQSYIDFYRQRVGQDGMVIHDSCACVYLVAPELFGIRRGPVRVICGGLADGKTIQAYGGRQAEGWSHCPSQSVCVAIEAEKTLHLIRDTLLLN